MRWTLIVEPVGRRGSENMAVDHSLVRAASRTGGGYLRLYRWSPPCLSFGRNEPATARYDRDLIARLGVDTVRRPTGGRAVWHDAELTYAVAAPCPTFGSLTDTYLTIHRMLAAALQRLGAAVDLAPRLRGRAPRPSAGACFATSVGGELVVRGAKLVGSAQLREGAAFLQHGSILLNNGQDLVARVSRGPAETPRAISLAEALAGATPATFGVVSATIADQAQRMWLGDWQAGPSPNGDRSGHYADPRWTWRV